MIQALYANATTLPTTLTVRKHGHVGLIMKDTLYTTLTTGTPFEDLDDPGASPTIATNVTFDHLQQDNDTYGEAHQIFENSATMDEALRHQIIGTIEDTYITEKRNKYTGFTGVKTINLVHHLINR